MYNLSHHQDDWVLLTVYISSFDTNFSSLFPSVQNPYGMENSQWCSGFKKCERSNPGNYIDQYRLPV